MGAFKSIYTDYACEPSQTLVSPKLTLEANAAGSLEFSVLPGQDGYDNTYTRPRNGYLIVLKDGEPIWDGRVTTRDMDWNNTKSIYAEGALSYLNDIMIQSLEDTSDFKTARANAKTDLKKKESAFNKAKKEWEDGGSPSSGTLYNKYKTAKKNLACSKKNYANSVYNANIVDPTDDELLLELIEDDYYGENGPKIFEMMLEKYNAQAENSNVHNQFVLGDVFVPAIHEAYEAADEDDYLIEWDSPDFTTVYEYFSSMLEKIPNTYLSVTYEYDKNNLLVRKLNWLLQGVNKDNIKTVKQYYNTNVKSAKDAYNAAAKTYNKWYVKVYDSAKDSEDIDALIKSNADYATKHDPLVTATNNLKTVNAAWNTYIKHLVDYSSPDIVVKQTVNFGENLLDFKRNIDSTEMFTRLIPIGEDDLYLNDDKSSAAIYVQDNELVAQYGVITRKMNFDKIRDAKTLKQQAKAELAKMKARIDGSKESIEITALDLRYYDSTAYYGKSLNIYDVVDCISAPHGFLTSNKFPVLKEEIEMAQPENTKFTLNAIIEYQSATSQLASTSANTMATASTVSTLGARKTGGGGDGGGNKIYTAKSAPIVSKGNEGDLWVEYRTDNSDKFINSKGEEVDVNIPRYKTADEALAYVNDNIVPKLRSIATCSLGEVNGIIKSLQNKVTIVANQEKHMQVGDYIITASQFPRLAADTYTINNQTMNVNYNYYPGADERMYYGFGPFSTMFPEHDNSWRYISDRVGAFLIVNVNDYNDGFDDNYAYEVYIDCIYLYYNTTTKVIDTIRSTGHVNRISKDYYFSTDPTSHSWDDPAFGIDLINTKTNSINDLYCKIEDGWNLYRGYKEKVLWRGSLTAAGTITLKDGAKNYDAIMLKLTNGSAGTNIQNQYIPVLASEITTGVSSQFSMGALVDFSFPSNTTFSLDRVNGPFELRSIIGIKFG